MKNRLLLIVFAFSLMTASADGFAGTVEILTFEYPPLMMEDGTGILQKILTEAAQTVGDTVTFLVYPRKRAMNMFEKTDTQLFLGESRYFPDMASAVEAQKLLYARVVLVYLKERNPPLAFAGLEDLKGKHAGVSLGSNLTPVFEKAGIYVQETATVENNIKKLNAQRIDVWGTVDVTAISFIEKHFPKQQDRFVIWEFERFPAEMLAKKNTPGDKMFQNLRTGFEHIVNNGKYKMILEEFYGKDQVPLSVMIK